MRLSDNAIKRVNELTERRKKTMVFIDEPYLPNIKCYLNEFVREIMRLIETGDVDLEHLCRAEFIFSIENFRLTRAIKREEDHKCD